MPSLVPILVKAVPIFVATLLTPTIAAREISEATSTYSIRFWPRSSSKASASVRIYVKAKYPSGAQACSRPNRRLSVPHACGYALGRPRRVFRSNPLSSQSVTAQAGTGRPAAVNGCSLRGCRQSLSVHRPACEPRPEIELPDPRQVRLQTHGPHAPPCAVHPEESVFAPEPYSGYTRSRPTAVETGRSREREWREARSPAGYLDPASQILASRR